MRFRSVRVFAESATYQLNLALITTTNTWRSYLERTCRRRRLGRRARRATAGSAIRAAAVGAGTACDGRRRAATAGTGLDNAARAPRARSARTVRRASRT